MLNPESGKIILQQDLKVNTIVDWCGGENAIFEGDEFYISARILNDDVIISKYKINDSYEAKLIWVKKFGVKPVIIERDEYKEEGLITGFYLNNDFIASSYFDIDSYDTSAVVRTGVFEYWTLGWSILSSFTLSNDDPFGFNILKFETHIDVSA